MQYGICKVAITPQRAEAKDSSEMVNQLLFGDAVKILEIGNDSWRKVSCIYDNYEGWVDVKQLYLCDLCTFKTLDLDTLNTSTISYSKTVNKEKNPIVLGSTLPNYNNGEFQLENQTYSFEASVIRNPKPNTEELLRYAKLFLNTPYLWGGKSILGIDCSGFTQIVFKLIGIALKRDASQQAEQGNLIDFIMESKAGDLAFFNNAERNIIHVGIMLSNHEIIHAYGKVRIDRIDQQGIFNSDSNNYSHHLRFIKRFLKNPS